MQFTAPGCVIAARFGTLLHVAAHRSIGDAANSAVLSPRIATSRRRGGGARRVAIHPVSAASPWPPSSRFAEHASLWRLSSNRLKTARDESNGARRGAHGRRLCTCLRARPLFARDRRLARSHHGAPGKRGHERRRSWGRRAWRHGKHGWFVAFGRKRRRSARRAGGRHERCRRPWRWRNRRRGRERRLGRCRWRRRHP